MKWILAVALAASTLHEATGFVVHGRPLTSFHRRALVTRADEGSKPFSAEETQALYDASVSLEPCGDKLTVFQKPSTVRAEPRPRA